MFTRRDFSLAAGASTFALASCANTNSDPSRPLESQAATVLQDAMAEKAVPGMAAIVIRDFRVETEYFAGVRALGSPARIGAACFSARTGDRFRFRSGSVRGGSRRAITATRSA